MNKYVKYGIYFLIAGIVINHLFRLVFHSVPVDKLIMGSDPVGYYQYLPAFFLEDWINSTIFQRAFLWRDQMAECFYLWCGHSLESLLSVGSLFYNLSRL